MGRILIFLFGVVSYVFFLGSFLYAIGFTGNIFVNKSIDSGMPGPLGESLLVNAILLSIFALQHSVMARPGFKRAWTKVVPHAMERSVYVLLASLALILLYWQWRPMTDVVWSVENTVGAALLWGLFALGWLTVLLSTFMIDHFDLFGLRQVYNNLLNQTPTPPPFQVGMLYRSVRHPIMLGFLIAFWATPHMSVGHLVFTLATTGYILVGIFFEERDMVAAHGETYLAYRRRVSMLIPFMRKGEK